MKKKIFNTLAAIFVIVGFAMASEDDYQQALASEDAHEHFQR
jgi:hypothetical protein